MKPFDLHTHSCCSDGTDTPQTLVTLAAQAGLGAVAVTDHDTMDGVPAALAAGEACGIRVIPGVELDQEWPYELHILGLGVDVHSAALQTALIRARERRTQRNERIRQQLLAAGHDVAPHLSLQANVTRLHFAKALVSMGAAKSISDAFARYLSPGTVGYAHARRLEPRESISLIHESGGVAVLAHPCNIRGNIHKLVYQLVQWGLDGIEAYYPGTMAGQLALFESFAAQYGLLVSCGSDYHGANRPDRRLGCAWQDSPSLARTAAHFQIP